MKILRLPNRHIEIRIKSQRKGYRLRYKNAKELVDSYLLWRGRLNGGSKLNNIANKPPISFKDFLLGPYAEFKSKQIKHWKKEQYRFRQVAQAFKGHDLDQVTTEMVDKYKLELQEHGKSPSSVNHLIKRVKNALKVAVKWGYIKKNVAEMVDLVKDHARRERFLTRKEYELLLIFAPEHIRPLIVIATNTGMRQGEILNLTQEDIDPERGFIRVMESKNGETRYVPMNQDVKETLQELLKHRKMGNPYLFHRGNTRLGSFRKSFSKAVEGAGIKNFRFHDLRHTCASWLAQEGVQLLTIKAVLGHKTLSMVNRYAHLTHDEMKKAVEKISEKGAQKGEHFQSSAS